ncbi:hypothetical protein D7Z26_22755 [Cohnella endophytica]|uniref:Uncharacterized protein n=1 Tax=Cohnella endophytica TaxID=2419778 RepID=A0A494XKF4_9BACL|nr:hypothetical protein [Cohnella endophytica]RKP48023.1 hypothetical protein D7Z26_22755 [Cohnella endophytica]
MPRTDADELERRLANRPFRQRRFSPTLMDAVERELQAPVDAPRRNRKFSRHAYLVSFALIVIALVSGAFFYCNVVRKEPLSAAIDPTEQQIVKNQYKLVVPRDWDASLGNDTTFYRNGTEIGGVDIVTYYPDQPISALYPNHHEVVENGMLDNLAAPTVIRTRMILTSPAAAEVQTSEEQLHYYFLMPESKIAYDLYFKTASVDDDTAQRIAESFEISVEDKASPEESQTPESTETPKPPESDKSQSQPLWEEIDRNGALTQYPVGEQLDALTYEQVMEGLSEPKPRVRWYSAYRIVEYDNVDRHEAIISALNRSVDDPEELVANAARFALSVMEGKYEEAEGSLKSPDGKAYAFVKYREAKFNDGKIWLAKNGRATTVYTPDIGGILDLGWSPDSQWLFARYAVQTASWIVLANAKTGEIRDKFDLVQRIIGDPANGYAVDPAKAPRFDPGEQLVDWSPNSKKFLFRYSFADENFMPYEGFGVYDLVNNKIEKVYMLPANESAGGIDSRPEGFSWN